MISFWTICCTFSEFLAEKTQRALLGVTIHCRRTNGRKRSKWREQTAIVKKEERRLTSHRFLHPPFFPLPWPNLEMVLLFLLLPWFLVRIVCLLEVVGWLAEAITAWMVEGEREGRGKKWGKRRRQSWPKTGESNRHFRLEGTSNGVLDA